MVVAVVVVVVVVVGVVVVVAVCLSIMRLGSVGPTLQLFYG